MRVVAPQEESSSITMFFSEQPGAQTVPFASEEMSVRVCKGDMQEAQHQIQPVFLMLITCLS